MSGIRGRINEWPYHGLKQFDESNTTKDRVKTQQTMSVSIPRHGQETGENRRARVNRVKKILTGK